MMEIGLMELEAFLELICSAASLEQLAELKNSLLGKKGKISVALKELSHLPLEARKNIAQHLNALKEETLTAISKRQKELEDQQWAKRLHHETIDVTLSAPPCEGGRFHPLMQVMAEVIEIFSSMGFSVRRGPDIETVFYNFEALNIGSEHPARAEQDTFYLGENLLRTQTSPVEIRTMMTEPLPIRIISPGRVYRADHDRTHTPMFHQVEGLVVEKGNIHMGHLKGCIEAFFQQFFNRPIALRFRPSFFPFTEPSAEVDLSFSVRGQAEEWLEVLGCGMTHPQVFKNCGLDPDEVQGFAFGLGIERLAMIKYGIEDIRLLYLNDQRWLQQYGFPCTEIGI